MTAQINPGPGYRLLEVGEIRPDIYEFFSINCTWVTGELPMQEVRKGDQPIRVKLPTTGVAEPEPASESTHMSIERILADRAKTHGKYSEHATITQSMKRIMEDRAGWDRLSPSQRETLHMIAHKIGRVLAGDPNVRDHWDDIAGYATLISREIDAEGEGQE